MHDNPDYQIGSPDMKNTLEKENRLYKTALDNEVDDLKGQALQIGRYALIAGGIVAGSYMLYKLLNNKDENQEQSNETARLAPIQSQVVVEKEVKENSFLRYIKEQLAFIALTILREKIADLTGIDKKKLIYNDDESSEKTEEK